MGIPALQPLKAMCILATGVLVERQDCHATQRLHLRTNQVTSPISTIALPGSELKGLSQTHND
jgi:hypothetical protein